MARRNCFESLEARVLFAGNFYSLRSDWSDVNNPNGSWTYREGTNALPHQASWGGGDFNATQGAWAKSSGGSNFVPAWFKSVGAETFNHDSQSGDIIVHTQDDTSGAGNGAANVLWTDKETFAHATVSIVGGVWMVRDIGRGNHWAILKNGVVLTEGDIASGDAYSRSSPFDLTQGSGGAAAVTHLPVAHNDTIELRITRSTAAGDYVGVNLSIFTSVPEIAGTVFDDKNSNGIVDGNDAILGDWKVYLDANNNGTFDAGETSVTSTSFSGLYDFIDIPTGLARVRQVLKPGYRKTLPGSGTPGYDINLTPANFESRGNDIGVTTNILLAGTVYNDVNSNGVKDGNESGLANVVVDIISNGSTVATRTTDAAGKWQVKGLAAGSGSAEILIPAGFTATNPVNGKYTGSATSGQQIGNLNFGLHTAAATAVYTDSAIRVSTFKRLELEE